MLIRAQNKSSEQIRSFMNFSETKSVFTYEWAFHRNSQNSNPPTLSGKIQFGKLLSGNSSNQRFLRGAVYSLYIGIVKQSADLIGHAQSNF